MNIGDVFSREEMNLLIKDSDPKNNKIEYNEFVDKMKNTTF